jgi:type IV pilus assembly protein PilW
MNMNSHRRQCGFSLIELMVGLVIGLIAILVIGQVLAAFEGNKRTSTGGGDAQTNGAAALAVLEQEIRMSGLGMITPGKQGVPGNLFCPLGVNIYYGGKTISNPGAKPSDGGLLAPVRIIDGGTGPDAIIVVRGDSEFDALVNTVKTNSTPPVITIDSNLGYGSPGQLFLVGAADGSMVCTLMQLSTAATASGNNWNLEYASGANFPYNPPDPTKAFATFPTYGAGAKVLNLGFSPSPGSGLTNLTAYRTFMYRRYDVLWCGASLPPQLSMVDPSQTPGPYTCANVQPLMDQVVDLQAQYGIAPATSQTVTEWRNATGVWAYDVLTAAQITRIKAVRISIIARSPQYEKDLVSPATLDAPWIAGGLDDPAPQYSTTAKDVNGRHYRYKVFTTVVPIKNVIWGNLP